LSEPLETELKLEITPSDQGRLDLSGLTAKPGGAAKSLISTYYDTPDQSLRKAGYSLRVRESGGRFVQTVKAQGGASAGYFVRPEWEQDIPRSRPVLDNAGPLAEVIGAQTLRGVNRAFVTEIERKTHRIDFEGATILIADDCGEVRAGRHAEQIREVELELERGDPRAIFMLARKIGGDVPVRLGVQSKSERGYQLLDQRRRKSFKSEPILLSPEDGTAAAFDTIAQSCIRQFRLNETLLLAKGAPEPVHQARVGLRRLRSAFSLFKPLYGDDARAELLRAELRWLAHLLGQVRDLDVLIPRLPDADRDAVAATREDVFARVMAEVDSARTRLLMLDLIEWLAFGEWRRKSGALDADIGSAARTILKTRRKKLKRHGRKLIDLTDEERHELRKEAKKLRYAAEFFETLYAEEPARTEHRHFLDRLQKLQDQLGELNDLAAYPALLAELGIDSGVPASSEDRDAMLEKAQHDYQELMALDRFWR
jgi:triphosphatase